MCGSPSPLQARGVKGGRAPLVKKALRILNTKKKKHLENMENPENLVDQKAPPIETRVCKQFSRT